MWSPWLLLRVAVWCCCSHTAMCKLSLWRAWQIAVAARERLAPTALKTLVCAVRACAGAARGASELSARSSLGATPHDSRAFACFFLIALRDARKRTSTAQRGSCRGLVSSRSASHFVVRGSKGQGVSTSVGRFTTPLDNAHRANNRSRPHNRAQPLHKKSSLHNLSSPTPPPRQNKDALRPLGNSKTALRAAAAPARPGPRVARRFRAV